MKLPPVVETPATVFIDGARRSICEPKMLLAVVRTPEEEIDTALPALAVTLAVLVGAEPPFETVMYGMLVKVGAFAVLTVPLPPLSDRAPELTVRPPERVRLDSVVLPRCWAWMIRPPGWA